LAVGHAQSAELVTGIDRGEHTEGLELQRPLPDDAVAA